MKQIFEKNWLPSLEMMSVLDTFNGYHKIKHDSAITYQNQLEFSEHRVKCDFS